MRLLQICTNFRPGGIQRHVMDLSDSLRSKGHKVFLSGSPGSWMDIDKDKDFLPLELHKVSKDGGNILFRIYHIFKTSFLLRRFIKKNSIELIHTHESAPVIVAKLATFGSNTPVLVTYHGSSPERIKSFGMISQLSAKYVITPSYRCASELNIIGGVSKNKLKVIGLGVQPPPKIPQERIDHLRNKLLGPDGKIVVVIIARLTYQKGIDVLIDVVSKVKEQRRDIQFILVGPGDLENKIEEWITEAGIQPFLHYCGVTEEPYLYLKAADLFLLTSRWEALPITIAEAFQSGLPVIATDTGGVSELVSPAVGRVNKIGDVAGIAASILEICNDDILRSKMSKNAVKLSQEDRFSLPHVHHTFEQTYAEILGVTLLENNG